MEAEKRKYILMTLTVKYTLSGYWWSSSETTRKKRFSLGTSVNQGELRTREQAKNESHEWSQRTHGVENEGEREKQ